MRKIMIIWDFSHDITPTLDKAALFIYGGPVVFHFVAFISHDTIHRTGIINPTAMTAMVATKLSSHAICKAPHKVFAVHQDNIAKWTSELCAEHPYDMVIKAVHLSDQALHTPTDWQLIRQLQVPLFLCGQQPLRLRKHVVVAIDLLNKNPMQQQLNQKVAAYGAEATLHDGALLHIIQVLPVNHFLQRLKLTSKQAVLAKAGPAMQAELQHWLEIQQLSHARIHLHAGVVAEEIQSLCRELKAELLVTGCPLQQQLNRNVASNTAERLLMLVSADLLVLKPDQVQL
jgi:nucleotide-binding universal stress UspA family protein